MSQHRKSEPERKTAGNPSIVRELLFAAVVAAIAALVVVALWRSRGPADSSGSVSEAPGANVVTAARNTNSTYERLVGKWVRTDGGYVIEIKSADSTGKLDAGYFNPNPIHVARAEASGQGSMTKVFIELRDVNYPGSTYTLAYDPASDQLRGIYYQAVQQAQYDVFFVRSK